MKNFIEEYGGALLAVAGTLILLGMLPGFAEGIKDNTDKVIENTQKMDAVEPNANIIPFSIDSVIYQYEEGMSWREWLNSSYNNGGFTVYVNPCTGEDMLGKFKVTNTGTGEDVTSNYAPAGEE